MATAERESDYGMERSANLGKLTDSLERVAFTRLERIAGVLAEYNMQGTISNIITIGEKLPAGRFDCFLCNSVQTMMVTSETVMRLPREVESWLGAYAQNFTIAHSQGYKRLLAALRMRYASEHSFGNQQQLEDYKATLENAGPGSRAPAGLGRGMVAAVATAPAPVQLRRTEFDPYKPWIYAPRQ